MSDGMSAASFGDMRVAHQFFQDGVEKCVQIQSAVDTERNRLRTGYNGGSDSSANVFFTKIDEWQINFDAVKGALARMTLELENSTQDYDRTENLNKEVAAAIDSKFQG